MLRHVGQVVVILLLESKWGNRDAVILSPRKAEMATRKEANHEQDCLLNFSAHYHQHS
jgi:hypothetical protein